MKVHFVFHTKYKEVNGALKIFETGVFWHEMTSALHLCMLELSRTNTFVTLNKSWTDILTVSDRKLPYTLQRGEWCFKMF